MGANGAGSDARRDPEAAHVLLLGAGREGVVEGAEFLVHRWVEVVEDLLPARRLVVAAGQEQLPGLRLTVPLAALGQEVGKVGVLRGGLLRRGRTGRQPRGVPALEHLDDGLDHFGSHLARFAHVLPPSSWSPAMAFPGGPKINRLREGCRTNGCPAHRAVWQQIAVRPPGTIAVQLKD